MATAALGCGSHRRLFNWPLGRSLAAAEFRNYDQRIEADQRTVFDVASRLPEDGEVGRGSRTACFRW
jgi:hypothetical protein